ncbi:Zn-ribbon domain-containing protein [Patescibacteria group bacterium]|nr:Zn-ribbon domain-containing protein [Patescibacteria group bacterium]
MIIGYSLYGPDNDSYMCSDCENIHEGMEGLKACPNCGYRTDFQYVNKQFKMKRRVYDFSFTYDGYPICSLRFKEFCVRQKYRNLEFDEFDTTNKFYIIRPTEILEYDLTRSHPRFDKFCDTCRNFESVTKPYPAYIQNITKELADGFYRSDLMFASGNEKSPLIIIGKETRERLKKEKMKGLEFQEING